MHAFIQISLERDSSWEGPGPWILQQVSKAMPHCQCCIYFESDIKDHYISIIVSTLNDISTDVSNRFGNTRGLSKTTSAAKRL